MFYLWTGHAKWTETTDEVRKKHIVYLQNELEVADKERRQQAIHSVLYLVQGKLLYVQNLLLIFHNH